MNIAVIGAAGRTGRRLVAQAHAAGHGVRALVRGEEQATMVRLHGAEPVVGDLLGEWAEVLREADAVVWAAGAGQSAAFEAIDRDALIGVAETLGQQGPRRLVVVSSVGVDRPDEYPPFLAAALRAKAGSDARVQASGLDWTIVRPGGLTDAPGRGRVQMAPTGLSGTISRDDVATVVLACLGDPRTVGKTFEVVAGERSVTDALASL